MSAVTFAISRLESIGDYCNAIVVKEVRQSLKSRQFVGTFILLLLVAWGGSVFGVSMSGDSIEYGSSAQGFFILFFLILCAASLLIVPYAAYRSIVEERAENTLELVQITALSPRQIVWGKSLNALVQVLVYFSAITPFIAFTSLLPGFDFVRTAFDLGMLLAVSFFFSSVALAIGAQTKTKMSQSFGSLGVIVMAFLGMVAYANFVLAAAFILPMGDAQFWWGVGIAVFLLVTSSFLCQQGAIAQLTFESDNRSSGIRLTVTIQWLVSWLAILASVAFFGGAHSSLMFTMVLLTTIFITLCGLYVIAEPEGLSRRVARGLPRSRWMRLIWVPFLPGGTRGLVFGLVSLAVMTALALVTVVVDSRTGASPLESTSKEWSAAATLVCYGVIYLGVGAFLTRLFRRVMTNFSPGHLLALLVLGNLLLIVLEFLWHFLSGFRDNQFQPIDIVNPVVTIGELFNDRAGATLAPFEAVIGAVLALLINWRAVVGTTREVLENPVRAQIELEAARRNQTQAAPLEGAVLEAGATAS
jgi:hypothetical protein